MKRLILSILCLLPCAILTIPTRFVRMTSPNKQYVVDLFFDVHEDQYAQNDNPLPVITMLQQKFLKGLTTYPHDMQFLVEPIHTTRFQKTVGIGKTKTPFQIVNSELEEKITDLDNFREYLGLPFLLQKKAAFTLDFLKPYDAVVSLINDELEKLKDIDDMVYSKLKEIFQTYLQKKLKPLYDTLLTPGIQHGWSLKTFLAQAQKKFPDKITNHDDLKDYLVEKTNMLFDLELMLTLLLEQKKYTVIYAGGAHMEQIMKFLHLFNWITYIDVGLDLDTIAANFPSIYPILSERIKPFFAIDTIMNLPEYASKVITNPDSRILERWLLILLRVHSKKNYDDTTQKFVQYLRMKAKEFYIDIDLSLFFLAQSKGWLPLVTMLGEEKPYLYTASVFYTWKEKDATICPAIESENIPLIMHDIKHGASAHALCARTFALHLVLELLGQKSLDKDMDYMPVIQMFLESIDDPNISDESGQTALHAVVKAHLYPELKEELITLLLQKNAHINAQDNLGNTPLHYAVENTQKAIIRFLINAGANPDIKNKKGKKAVPFHTRLFI